MLFSDDIQLSFHLAIALDQKNAKGSNFGAATAATAATIDR